MKTIFAHDSVRIRPYTAEDAAALYAAVSGSLTTLNRWLPWARPDYSPGDSEVWIAHCLRSWSTGAEYPFGIFDAASGRLLGGVGLNALHRARRSANLGYWVADDARGRGVAGAAARLAAQFGFAELGLHRVEILILPDNHVSRRVAIKLGATCEGIARNAVIFEGKPQEAMVFSLIPEDLIAHGSAWL
jgi:ribosomal-protein-serine acetyltransferase